MEVLINTDAGFEYHAGDKVPQFPFRGDLMLATDPGKTNMCVTVGTPDGTILTILQFRAPGSINDNSQYCHDFKVFLATYLQDCRVKHFAIEAAISKKGMEYHRSSFTLTEIRANLIDLAYQLTGKKAFEVNNWSWKYAILPDGMRGQHEKGSARFLSDVYEVYGNADVTDSICIYRYAVSKIGNPHYVINPIDHEEPLAKYRLVLSPYDGSPAMPNVRECFYNPSLSLVENVAFAINRTTGSIRFIIPAKALTLDEIYSSPCLCFGPPLTDRLEVLATRCG